MRPYVWYCGRKNVGHLNPLHAKLNPICHLLALLGAHHILHVSRIKVNIIKEVIKNKQYN
jgi:hypothetical protein